MEKLELKHLSGYLPYGLKVDGTYYDEDYKSELVTGINQIDVIVDFGWSSSYGNRIVQEFSIEHIKPILRPLSDLTKEIEVNGEKFVPIIELLKLDYPTQDKTGKYSEISVNKQGYPSAFFTYQANRCLTVYTNHIDGIPFWIIQKLYEWHFAINIPKHLYIDINTLTKQ